MIGIVGYGSYLPRFRIRADDIARQWGRDPETVKRGLLLKEKTVPGPDEDTITISVEAARNALKRADIEPGEIGSLYIGSESHPYAVKPSGTVVAEVLGITPEVHIADYEFACKAGTEAMFVAYSQVKAELVKYAMAIGADTSQGAPGDALEFSASAGGSAFIFGREKVIAEVIDTYSYATDTADFWRREGAFYPLHGGRFTGAPAYFKHILGAGRAILKKSNLKPEDFKYAVFHMPNGKFPLSAGKRLGFKREQLEPGWIVPTMGNTYSGSSPTGFSATLDIAKPGDLILLVSFGSGAGSDAFIFKVTERIEQVRDRAQKVQEMLSREPIYLDYGQYAKFRGKIIMNE
ncbi:hydroxymethylglutaryl-CoA synthase [candidate division WOR-3 bacterium 4484_100]|uniref:Hydroxymethylglutaryl-CoA synthase n=1 Tax=candidate division WOR-3 bacterium 4484_100 TaxID=1936077 RepID=A0A1V4QFN7_UNCW3|nr:MAG: hydroxymethylglutaryl-CoA synthase [candidate division WOR-3 bacterium 4484_100]